MSSNHEAFGFFCFGSAAAQDRGDDMGWNHFVRHPNQVQSSQRTPSHGIHIRQSVGRRNLAVQKWIINDGRKKIHRLHQGSTASNTVHTRIVGRIRCDEQTFVHYFGKLAQNLRQGLLAQLGSSTRTGRKRCEFKNLLARHA
jgi:hypothetical protein